MHWPPEQVLQWLHFLTRQVLERESLVFSTNHLQATWLTSAYRRLYRWSLRLVVGGSSGLLFGLGCAIYISQGPIGLNAALLPVVVCGLVFGVLCGFLFKPGEGLRPGQTIIWNRRWLNWSKGALAYYLLLELFPMLGVGLMVNGLLQGFPLLRLVLVPFFIVVTGLSIGFYLPFEPHLITRSLLSPTEDIPLPGKLLGLLVWLMNVLSWGLFSGMFVSASVRSEAGLLIYYTPLGQLLGVLLICSLCFLVIPLGQIFWLPACLSAGPAMIAQPLLLRLFLRLSNKLPWDLHSLLDQAVEQGMLCKVEGGYRLSSRLLLSYFDALDQPVPPHIAVLQDQCSVFSLPTSPVCGKPAIITYDGLSGIMAQRLTMHWGFNTWKDITDTEMTRARNGTWQAIITVPLEATVLNMAFYDQNDSWDNHHGANHHLKVSP